MIDRRQLLIGAFGATGALLGGTPSLAVAPLPTAALFDPRYADGRRFAAAAARLGAVPTPISDDRLRLWTEVARRDLRRVICLATHADQMVLARLAGDAGGRIWFLAEHDAREADVVRHRVRVGETFDPSNAAWAELLAARLLDMPASGVGGRPARRADDFPGTLISWAVEFRA